MVNALNKLFQQYFDALPFSMHTDIANGVYSIEILVPRWYYDKLVKEMGMYFTYHKTDGTTRGFDGGTDICVHGVRIEMIPTQCDSRDQCVEIRLVNNQIKKEIIGSEFGEIG